MCIYNEMIETDWYLYKPTVVGLRETPKKYILSHEVGRVQRGTCSSMLKLSSTLFFCVYLQMGVSENSGTPKSSILIGFSIINHPFWGYPYFWKYPNDFMFMGGHHWRGFWADNPHFRMNPFLEYPYKHIEGIWLQTFRW